MKNKKMIALGMVAAVTMATVAPVYAAENAMTGGGSTTVTYTPGESTGGDGDGNLASWTVDYPVKITLDDSMLSDGKAAPAHSRDVNFAAYNTGTKDPYTGGATIQVSLESLGANGNADGSINMLDSSGAATDGVVMKLWNKNTSANVATNAKTEFAQLSSAAGTEATLNAYLFNNANAKSDMTYTQKLTWIFESAKY